MKQLLLVVFTISLFSFSAKAQENNSQAIKENYRNLFVGACVQEAKKQKLGIDSKAFCNCSFEKLFKRIEDTGIDLEEAGTLIDKISKSPEYEREVEECLSIVMGNGDTGYMNAELRKICIKSMGKSKYMRKNANIEEVCDCTIAKYQDSQYSLMDFSRMSEQEAAGFFEKISQECILYYFENKK